MKLVKTKRKKYKDYLGFMDEDTKAELKILVDKLKDKRIAMVNATEFGGGVAEILHSMVPLIKDMGLSIDWWRMYGEEEFYNVTKKFHNRLQGEEGNLTEEEIDIYLKYIKLNASKMKNWDYDFLVIHDPQPAGLIEYGNAGDKTRWIWRCHIDTSTPNSEYWDFLYKYIVKYDAVVFTMKDFVPESLYFSNLTYITPPIDPLSAKNIPLDMKEAEEIISKFGIDINRPLITQISRFDPWKDPLELLKYTKL